MAAVGERGVFAHDVSQVAEAAHPCEIAAIEAAGEKLDETGGATPYHLILQKIGSCNLDETGGATSHHQILQEIG